MAITPAKFVEFDGTLVTLKWRKHERQVPISQITGLQIKEPGRISPGSVTFGIMGSDTRRMHIIDGNAINTPNPDNTVAFIRRDAAPIMETVDRIREAIKSRSA